MHYIATRWEKSQADVDSDAKLHNHLNAMAAKAPAAQGSRQPPEAEAGFSRAQQAAEAAVTPGLRFVWNAEEFEVKSFRVSSQMDVRSVKEMVNNYFGTDGAYILGFLKREMGTQVKANCTTDIDASAMIGGELMSPTWGRQNPGVVEEFFRVRNLDRWKGESFGSSGAASFPGLSNHAGRGAFDLKYHFILLDSAGNESQKSSWGKSGMNADVENMDNWVSVKMLKHCINEAASLQLDVIDNTTP